MYRFYTFYCGAHLVSEEEKREKRRSNRVSNSSILNERFRPDVLYILLEKHLKNFQLEYMLYMVVDVYINICMPSEKNGRP